jgi:DNA mismatch repair protein MSH2
LSSLEQIVERQNIVELFFDDHELRGTLQENLLKRVPDVNRLMRKIVKGNAGLQVRTTHKHTIDVPHTRHTRHTTHDTHTKLSF